MYSLRWILYFYMGRGLENKIPAYTLILFLCLPLDVSELKLWTYTSWSYNIIIIYIQWVLYKSNNTIKMSLYNWGFVVRQRNRSWWKFRRENLENCRFLITKTTIMDRRFAVNSRRYITFDRGVMIALIHF